MRYPARQACRVVQVPRLLLFGLFLCCPLPASADTVFLRSGKQVEGVVEEQGSRGVSVRTRQGRVTIPASNVERVEKDTRRANATVDARNAFGQGEAARALALIIRPGTDANPAETDRMVLEWGPDILKQAAGASPADAARFVSYVQDRPTSAPDALRFLLARYLVQRGDVAGASAEIHTIPPMWLTGRDDLRAGAVDILRRSISRLIALQDTSAALADLRLLAAIAPEQISGQSRSRFEIGEADRLASAGRWQEAVTLLARDLLPVAPALAAESLGDVLRAAQTVTTGPELLRLYDTAVANLPETTGTDEMRAILANNVRIRIEAGDFQGARNAADRLGRVDPDNGAAWLHRVEFAQRRAATDPDDMLAQYRLGTWALEMGLEDEARSQFLIASRSVRVRENARLQLELLSVKEQKAEFGKVSALFETGNFRDAIVAAEAFRKRYPRGDYAREAGALVEVAKYRMTRERDVKAPQAFTLLQNAEHLHLQGRNDEAIAILDRLSVDYAGSGVSRQASALRTRVRETMRRRSEANAPIAEQQEAQLRKIEEIRRFTEKLTGRPLDPQQDQ